MSAPGYNPHGPTDLLAALLASLRMGPEESVTLEWGFDMTADRVDVTIRMPSEDRYRVVIERAGDREAPG